MTLQQLEYIVALDNYRHYVTAAEKCYVSQPNLTMQIKKLEDEIGVAIFDREKKPLQPTAAGEQVLMQARQILREVQRLKELVSIETESLEGEFTIGIIPTLAPYLLPLFLPGFLKENPKTHLKIKELTTDAIIEGLLKGTLDMGLLATPLEKRGIREVPIFYESFLLYLSDSDTSGFPKTVKPEDLDTGKVLVLDEGHCFREQTLAICSSRKASSDVGFQYSSGSIEALKGLVRKGIGYTLVPELSVLDEQKTANVRRFAIPEPVREVSIVVHQTFTKEALIEHLRDSIVKSIPESFKKTKKHIRVRWR